MSESGSTVWTILQRKRDGDNVMALEMLKVQPSQATLDKVLGEQANMHAQHTKASLHHHLRLKLHL